jgi:hypothetical protein
MDFSEYRFLRERLGSRDKVAKILDVTTTSIARRENGKQRVTREAGFALLWALQQEEASPSPNGSRLAPRYGAQPRRKK